MTLGANVPHRCTPTAGRSSATTLFSGLAAVVLLAVYLGVLAPWSPAQQGGPALGVWTPVNNDPGVRRPEARDHAAVAFDPNGPTAAGRGRVMLFGGAGANGAPLGDTWSWDGTAWRDLNPRLAPARRSGAVMAYDGQRVVLFGGETPTGITADMWFWDEALQEWAALNPPTRPPPRRDATMAYDQRSGRVVLFGGAGPTTTPGATTVLDDTWLWDGMARSWTQVGPGGSTPSTPPAPNPPARRDAAMAYDAHPDANRNHVVLFGGWDGTRDLADTWVWDGQAWSMRETPPELGARTQAAMAFDPKARSVVMTGGRQHPAAAPGQGTPPDTVLGDTWIWDGERWADAHPTSSPGERSGAAMAALAVSEDTPSAPAVVLFGGRGDERNNRSLLEDTWLWEGTSPVPTTSSTSSTSTTSTTAPPGTTTSTSAPGGSTGGGGTGSGPSAAPPANSGGGTGDGGTATGGGGTGGGGQVGQVDTSGGFESTAGNEGAYGFFPGGAGSGFEGAAALTGLAAAPPPPAPAGSPAPVAGPGEGFLPPPAGPNVGPVGAAAPGSSPAPTGARRFLMVSTDDPAALGTLGGAGVMFAVFCVQVVRRRAESASAASQPAYQQA